MSLEKSILLNVLNQEVVFEEYFCNLLKEEKFFNKFIDFISSKNDILKNKNINYKMFYTEYNLQIKEKNFGRADIYLDLDSEKIIFEIKNKVYTDLTPNQTGMYLDYLKKVNKKKFDTFLLFILPKRYAHEELLHDRWSKKSYHYKENIKNHIFYWEDFVKTLKGEDNPFVKAFYEFCIYWFDMESITFTKEEKNQIINLKGNSLEIIENETIPTLLVKIEKCLIRIGSDKLKWEQISSEKGAYISGHSYSKKINSYTVVLGLDYDMWSKFKQPINIYISNYKDSSQHFEKPNIDDISFEIFEIKENSTWNDFFVYVVQLDFSIDDENFEDKIIELIKRIEKTLKTKTN